MKRTLILFLAILMALNGCALAEMPVEMRVVNCQEWVSLRAEPSSEAQRFVEVPLGATVRGFYQSNGDFSQCAYQGRVGYILNQYLEQSSEELEMTGMDSGEPAFELKLSEGSVRVWQARGDAGETLYLARYSAQDERMWDYATESLETTELESLNVFLNENAEADMVMVYNSYYGLTALNAETGEKLWTLTCAEISLGGSIKTAIGQDGTMYIGGYYGPDPAAISADGKVLYRCSSLHEDAQLGETTFYWMREIEVLDEGGICVHYENGDAPVRATFDGSGNMLSWEEE